MFREYWRNKHSTKFILNSMYISQQLFIPTVVKCYELRILQRLFKVIVMVGSALHRL